MADTEPVFRLVYRSQLTIPPEERGAQIASILEASRRKNNDRQVTGALLIWQDYVVQTLEGQEDVVRGLYSKIADDARHEAVTLLEAQDVEGRNFPKWSMARISDMDQPNGIPMLSNNVDEIGQSPDYERRESDPVITAMRGYAEPRGTSGVFPL